MNVKRNQIIQEYMTLYRRGEISKAQFLIQKKAMLQEEAAEKEAELQALSGVVSHLALQIEGLDQELAALKMQG